MKLATCKYDRRGRRGNFLVENEWETVRNLYKVVDGAMGHISILFLYFLITEFPI
jgi:hypothetical protein